MTGITEPFAGFDIIIQQILLAHIGQLAEIGIVRLTGSDSVI